MEVILKFQYVIVISFFVLINIGCQISKKETFDLPHIRKIHFQDIDFDKATYDKDTRMYSQFFETPGYVYSVGWDKKDVIIGEMYKKGGLIEIYTYHDNRLNSKTKSRRGEFEPYYKEDIADNAEQTEDSIFYYLKNK
ncbi:hypothetical protein CH365_04395 [Leptospira neocaledonica]|uniref:Uncharacterized protein n=2 Tax=Leptospira neocaledonica TaxID=2023192 RepID=A0A2N0A2J4_9LEPT|nr:hypothetical protein CH365_04395 [Leptospira neocaledonica]